MEYRPDAVNRDLARVRDGAATFEQRARLETYLLGLLREAGPEGVARLLLGLEGHQFVEGERGGAGQRSFVGRGPSEGSRLLVTTFLTEHSASVNVEVEPQGDSAAEPDWRHERFYAIWEGLLGATPSEVAAFEHPRRAVYLVGLLEAEIMNGGLGQYLANTEAKHLAETLACLERIRAPRTHAVLSAAAEIGGEFASYLDAWEEDSSAFSRLDAEFEASGEDLAALTAEAFLQDEQGGDDGR